MVLFPHCRTWVTWCLSSCRSWAENVLIFSFSSYDVQTKSRIIRTFPPPSSSSIQLPCFGVFYLLPQYYFSLKQFSTTKSGQLFITLHTLPSLPRASRRGSFIPLKHGKNFFKMLVLTATSWNELNNLNQILCSEDKRTSKRDNGLSTVVSHLEVIWRLLW